MIRTLLTVSKFDRDRRLVDLRQQYSRSFTKHLIEGLYLSHAHLVTGSALSVADVMGSITRLVDGDYNASYPGVPKGNMRIAGPAGFGAESLTGGDSSTAGLPIIPSAAFIPGHVFGIQIGRGSAAPTPTDARLADRVNHGRNGSVGAPAVIDQVIAGDTTDFYYTVNNGYIGMVYVPLRSFTLTSAQFKVWRTGNPGNVTCNIIGLWSNAAVDAPRLDTTIIGTSDVVNANLWPSSSPGSFQTFNFSTPVQLQAGCLYGICIYPSQVSSGNYVNMRYMAGATNNPRQAMGTWPSLGGAGVSWGTDSLAMYIFTGTAGAEMEYGATDLYGLTVANPNASFTMRRIFMNNSGEAITVQECGIYFPLGRYTGVTGYYNIITAFIVCAARDTFAGIPVNNGESLEVGYTPSITV